MDVNEHERLSNLTLPHKFKKRNSACIGVLHLTVTIGSLMSIIPYNEGETAHSLDLNNNLF
jgi:hypothetical protein